MLFDTNLPLFRLTEERDVGVFNIHQLHSVQQLHRTMQLSATKFVQ